MCKKEKVACPCRWLWIQNQRHPLFMLIKLSFPFLFCFIFSNISLFPQLLEELNPPCYFPHSHITFDFFPADSTILVATQVRIGCRIKERKYCGGGGGGGKRKYEANLVVFLLRLLKRAKCRLRISSYIHCLNDQLTNVRETLVHTGKEG